MRSPQPFISVRRDFRPHRLDGAHETPPAPVALLLPPGQQGSGSGLSHSQTRGGCPRRRVSSGPPRPSIDILVSTPFISTLLRAAINFCGSEPPSPSFGYVEPDPPSAAESFDRRWGKELERARPAKPGPRLYRQRLSWFPRFCRGPGSKLVFGQSRTL
jgi:hypothetical protein